jgi:hypothetical protein
VSERPKVQLSKSCVGESPPWVQIPPPPPCQIPTPFFPTDTRKLGGRLLSRRMNRPQFAHNCAAQPFIQSPCNRVQIVVEEVRVHVQGHARRRVSEHPLHGLHIHPGGHRETCSGVSERMRGSMLKARLPDSLSEPAPTGGVRAGPPHEAAVWTSEYQIVHAFPFAQPSERDCQSGREWAGAGLVRLRGANLDAVAHLHCVVSLASQELPEWVDALSAPVKVRKRRWEEWVAKYYEPVARAREEHFLRTGEVFTDSLHMPDAPWDPDDL